MVGFGWGYLAGFWFGGLGCGEGVWFGFMVLVELIVWLGFVRVLLLWGFGLFTAGLFIWVWVEVLFISFVGVCVVASLFSSWFFGFWVGSVGGVCVRGFGLGRLCGLILWVGLLVWGLGGCLCCAGVWVCLVLLYLVVVGVLVGFGFVFCLLLVVWWGFLVVSFPCGCFRLFYSLLCYCVS